MNGSDRSLPQLRWAVVAAALVCGVAWGTRPESARPVDWRRTDLTLVKPRSGRQAWKPIVATLGQRLSWPGSSTGPGLAPAGEVRALWQAPGEPMSWPVRGARPSFLSFTPLDGEGVAYRVVAIDRWGHRGVQHQTVARPLAGPAPAPIEVELPIGTTAVSLEASAHGGASSNPHAVWGMPALYSVAERSSTGEATARRPSKPHVILIGIDTLRADALGVSQTARSVTPNLDAFARRADVWDNAYSTCNATNPSFASILTGLYVKHHGVTDLTSQLANERVTLAEIYAAHGYRTEAVISARHLGTERSGITQGFQGVHLAGRQFAAEAAVDRAIGLLQSTREPLFLWLHLFDPHTPHTPPSPFANGLVPSGVNGLRQPSNWSRFRTPGLAPFLEPVLGGNATLYAAEVAAVDRQLGRLFEVLERSGDESLVAVVSDHGENLGEHGVFYRHSGLFETTTRVPLMIRLPTFRTATGSLRGLVQTLDLFPTLLKASGLPIPSNDGIDLYELAPRGATGGRRAVFAEEVGGQGATIRTHDWRYAELTRGGPLATGSYLFDLRNDPREIHNLAGRGLAVEMDLARALGAWRDQRRPNGDSQSALDTELTDEELAQLRALGYL